MPGFRHKQLTRKRHSATSMSSEQDNADGVASQGLGAASVQRPDVDVTSQELGTGAIDATSHELGTTAGDDSNEAIVSTIASQPKKPRGRGKKNRTQFRLPPSHEKVELVPKGDKQFTYATYHPTEYKYGSQVGVILKRLYPGLVDVRDEEGNIVDKRPAMCWFDYLCKKDERGVTSARLVKQEFWSVFRVARGHVRKANRNLENYLAKRVPDMMYRARIDAIKDHEGCNDAEAKNILLTEEEFISCRQDWCPMDAWALLAKHWASKDYQDKRLVAQNARAKGAEDSAQNRGGSRPWAETQQYLEYKFGPERTGTLNTYAVMKSGFKNVDSTGRSAPVRSRKAKERLDNYVERAQPSENSKELDGQVLYFMENGLCHGRLPIADGAVDKENIRAVSKSNRLHSASNVAYLSAIEENERLKETCEQLQQTNAKLQETNEILTEENSVGRDLSLRLYEQLNKEAPADLLARLASLENRRNKITCSSGVGSCQDDMHDNQDEMRTDSDDDDYDIEDEESCHDSSGDDTDENSCEGSKVNSDYSGNEVLEDN